MKTLIKTSLIIVLMLAGTGIISAQYTIRGEQTRGEPGKNAELKCSNVSVNKTVTIKSVSGNNAGFWIVDNKGKVYNFWQPNDNSALGLKLPPGAYKAYPNLKQNNNKASVIIYLE